MGSPVPVVLTSPVFHSGFPSYTMSGPMTFCIFQVLLVSGEVIDAVVKGEMVFNEYTYFWYRTDPQRTRIPAEEISGWRDDTVCADYALAIAHWAWEPYGVVNKGEWGHALGRHIAAKEGDTLTARVTCEPCARLFVRAWRAKRGTVPEGWEAYA